MTGILSAPTVSEKPHSFTIFFSDIDDNDDTAQNTMSIQIPRTISCLEFSGIALASGEVVEDEALGGFGSSSQQHLIFLPGWGSCKPKNFPEYQALFICMSSCVGFVQKNALVPRSGVSRGASFCVHWAGWDLSLGFHLRFVDILSHPLYSRRLELELLVTDGKTLWVARRRSRGRLGEAVEYKAS
jgi:hypothetical protein